MTSTVILGGVGNGTSPEDEANALEYLVSQLRSAWERGNVVVEISQEAIDVTSFGDTYKKFQPTGINNYAIRFSGQSGPRPSAQKTEPEPEKKPSLVRAIKFPSSSV